MVAAGLCVVKWNGDLMVPPDTEVGRTPFRGAAKAGQGRISHHQNCWTESFGECCRISVAGENSVETGHAIFVHLFDANVSTCRK